MIRPVLQESPMRRLLTLNFGRAGTLEVPLSADDPGLESLEAREWLDRQFVALECEPLRASGKLLTADKVLAVTAELGHGALAADEALRTALARAVLGALGQPLVTVDTEGGTVTF
jgi:hypothetical protein